MIAIPMLVRSAMVGAARRRNRWVKAAAVPANVSQASALMVSVVTRIVMRTAVLPVVTQTQVRPKGIAIIFQRATTQAMSVAIMVLRLVVRTGPVMVREAVSLMLMERSVRTIAAMAARLSRMLSVTMVAVTNPPAQTVGDMHAVAAHVEPLARRTPIVRAVTTVLTVRVPIIRVRRRQPRTPGLLMKIPIRR